ncbi:MAG: hypothetical protein V7K48_19790 [Nostoc sp.]|uniref:hypothetical protein n=1 Tax=Nostoc sp. TaxID=1180 RepID=UPI002FF54F25
MLITSRREPITRIMIDYLPKIGSSEALTAIEAEFDSSTLLKHSKASNQPLLANLSACMQGTSF